MQVLFKKYRQYELTLHIPYSEDYNSWVSLLFPRFCIISTHSAVMSMSAELMEVNLDDIPEQLHSIYYEWMYMSQHFSVILTMCDQISVMLLILMILNVL